MASVNLIPVLAWATLIVAACIISPWFLVAAFALLLLGAAVD